MDIENLTIAQARQIAALFPVNTAPAADTFAPFLGKSVFLRTVTHYLTGKLVAVGATELVLESAAWIADTGRYADALKTGTLGEVEPYPDGPVLVGRGALIDGCLWPHALPRAQK